jgi:hypothetical protein
VAGVVGAVAVVAGSQVGQGAPAVSIDGDAPPAEPAEAVK